MTVTGRQAPALLMLDQIEEAIEDHLTVECYEMMMRDSEHAHLTHIHF